MPPASPSRRPGPKTLIVRNPDGAKCIGCGCKTCTRWSQAVGPGSAKVWLCGGSSSDRNTLQRTNKCTRAGKKWEGDNAGRSWEPWLPPPGYVEPPSPLLQRVGSAISSVARALTPGRSTRSRDFMQDEAPCDDEDEDDEDASDGDASDISRLIDDEGVEFTAEEVRGRSHAQLHASMELEGFSPHSCRGSESPISEVTPIQSVGTPVQKRSRLAFSRLLRTPTSYTQLLEDGGAGVDVGRRVVLSDDGDLPLSQRRPRRQKRLLSGNSSEGGETLPSRASRPVSRGERTRTPVAAQEVLPDSPLDAPAVDNPVPPPVAAEVCAAPDVNPLQMIFDRIDANAAGVFFEDETVEDGQAVHDSPRVPLDDDNPGHKHANYGPFPSWMPSIFQKNAGRELPPRHRYSPLREADGKPLIRRHVDVTIVMTPCRAIPSETRPNPLPINRAQREKSCRYFMPRAAKLLREMHSAGFLVHAAGGSERGDEAEHEHSQIAARFFTRRKLKNFEDMLRVVLSSCCLEDPAMSHRIAVKLRGTQTELYNLGYALKGSLNPSQPYNIWPGEEGHFEINMVDEFAPARCLEAYEAVAGNNSNPNAGKKAGFGAYLPTSARGKDKVIILSKSNVMQVAAGFCQRAGLSKLMLKASLQRQMGWTVQGGRHVVAPSWAVTYADKPINEEQLATVMMLGLNHNLGCDIRLMTMVMYKRHEVDRYETGGLTSAQKLLDTCATGVTFRSTMGGASSSETDELWLHEAQKYEKNNLVPEALPVRLQILRLFRPQAEPRGTVLVMDFNCDAMDQPAAYLMMELGRRQFNLVPRVYDIAHGTGSLVGFDSTVGLRALSHIHLATVDTELTQPLERVTFAQMIAFETEEMKDVVSNILHEVSSSLGYETNAQLTPRQAELQYRLLVNRLGLRNCCGKLTIAELLQVIDCDQPEGFRFSAIVCEEMEVPRATEGETLTAMQEAAELDGQTFVHTFAVVWQYGNCPLLEVDDNNCWMPAPWKESPRGEKMRKAEKHMSNLRSVASGMRRPFVPSTPGRKFPQPFRSAADAAAAHGDESTQLSPSSSICAEETEPEAEAAAPDGSGFSGGFTERPFVLHARARFMALRCTLSSHPDTVVTIASADGMVSSLGKGVAVQQWADSPYGEAAYQRFIAILDAETVSLHALFPTRVTFGTVSGANASSTHLQVWGANSQNWNLPEGEAIPGSGQAACMAIQKAGVFGVITTPSQGEPFYRSMRSTPNVSARPDTSRSSPPSVDLPTKPGGSVRNECASTSVSYAYPPVDRSIQRQLWEDKFGCNVNEAIEEETAMQVDEHLEDVDEEETPFDYIPSDHEWNED